MIYIDESIQQDLGYICVGFAYCNESLDVDVDKAISDSGLKPNIDEYKSGARMQGNQTLKKLRDSIFELVLTHCKLGIYIADVSERPHLLTPISKVCHQIAVVNNLQPIQKAFIDEGITGEVIPSNLIEIIPNCDSKLVSGIQLADFVAYHCSYLLKCTLNGSSKKYKWIQMNHIR